MPTEEEKLAKTYETVKEINADDVLNKMKEVGDSLGDKIEAGIDYISKKVGDVLEKGKKYRVSFRDKNGDTHFKTTMTLGAFGLTLAALFAPVVTFFVGIISVLVGSANDYSIVIEKVVETPDVAPPA
jgi:hypothetical protein